MPISLSKLRSVHDYMPVLMQASQWKDTWHDFSFLQLAKTNQKKTKAFCSITLCIIVTTPDFEHESISSLRIFHSFSVWKRVLRIWVLPVVHDVCTWGITHPLPSCVCLIIHLNSLKNAADFCMTNKDSIWSESHMFSYSFICIITLDL